MFKPRKLSVKTLTHRCRNNRLSRGVSARFLYPHYFYKYFRMESTTILADGGLRRKGCVFGFACVNRSRVATAGTSVRRTTAPTQLNEMLSRHR